MSQKYNSEYINELEAFFIGRNDTINRYGNMISHFQALPGLVGLWYPGNVQRSTGNIYDYSGQGRTLTYNGNPTINYLSNGVAYASLDGVGDYWSRADEVDLRIRGNEAFVTNPGITFGGWFNSQKAIGSFETLISKRGAAVNFAYWIVRNNTGEMRLAISTDGTTTHNAVTTETIPTGVWFLVVGSWSPSTVTRIQVWIPSTNSYYVTENTFSVPATIFNGTADFNISGYNNGTQLFEGYVSTSFLCASYHSLAMNNSLYQQTRSLYGV